MFSTALFALLINCHALRVETYGDSLTAGFLANSSLTNPPPLEDIGVILTNLSLFRITGEEKYLSYYKIPETTWGYKLATKFSSKAPTTYINMAKESHKTFHIPEQIRQVPKTTEPTIGFVLIGHNDLCNPKDSSEHIAGNFVNKLNEGLAIWDDNHKNSTLYLIEVGDVPKVFDLLEKVEWYKTQEKTLTCDFSWKKIFPYCPYFAKLQNTGRIKEVLTPTLKLMNQSLPGIATQMTAKSANNNQYMVLKSSNETQYEIADFAVDCFHLSEKGQGRLADAVWKDLGN